MVWNVKILTEKLVDSNHLEEHQIERLKCGLHDLFSVRHKTITQSIDKPQTYISLMKSQQISVADTLSAKNGCNCVNTAFCFFFSLRAN